MRIVPPLSWTSSRTTDRPIPWPLIRSSRRAPRSSTRERSSTGMPGPSSSTTRRKPSRRAVGSEMRSAVSRTLPRLHLNALSMRLPATSVRSSRSPVNIQPGATASSQSTSRSAYTLSSAPRRGSSVLRTSIGAVPSPTPPDAAARFSWYLTMSSIRPTCSSSCLPIARSRPCVPLSRLRITASGVLKLCARLPSVLR